MTDNMNDGRWIIPSPTNNDSPEELALEKLNVRPTDLERIRQSNLIEGIDDPAEDKKSLSAWNWLKTRAGINQTVLLELHRRITEGQLDKSESGHYRKIQVYVGDHVPTHPANVAQSTGYWLNTWLEQEPKTAHIKFERIHPFVDGNGRTGRMLMWWQELKLGKEPTLILDSQKRHYYKWFTEVEGVRR